MYNQSCDIVKIVPARRKIGNTRISVSGLYPFKKDSAVAFESTLERDFLIRLEIDPNVLAVESQPFTIEYSDNGQKRVYTPDFLVTYKHDDYLPFIAPRLVEVKPIDELQLNLPLWKARYRAAMRVCKEEGWKFNIAHEGRIRDQLWSNAMFLQKYRKMEFPPADSKHLLDYVRVRGAVTFETLLARHFLGKWDKAIGISQIWYLVSHGYLICDLSAPLQPSTELWVSESCYE
ncbi:TnsA endonuclease N-terminal domain-containing protein [Acinetobacter higginsii]|uniref:TnsA endonuclease N-terminal domain-containing protein n=1 Tax=Acinetobacter higginsii TaxID=70347 RepID=UPI00300984FD